MSEEHPPVTADRHEDVPPGAAHSTAHSAATRDRGVTALGLAGVASAGAGLVHAAAAGTHNGDTQLMLLFAVTAVVQLGWAATAANRRTSRNVALVGVALGSLAVGAWVLSRTTGLPFIDSLSDREPAGVQDAVAAVLGGFSALLAAASALGVSMPRTVLRAPLAGVGAVALLALAVPGVAAQHAHGPSHDHDEASVAAGSGHDHAAGGTEDAGEHDGHGDHEVVDHTDEDHEGEDHSDDAHSANGHSAEPMVSLTDDRLDEAQRAAAQDLIDRTTEGMSRFSTVESVRSAGYVSIGDGPTGWEHYVHLGHMSDGVDLDPDAIESVVFKVYPDGTRQLASAMYILGFGATMDDVPDIAGELTSWHDHQDLCWEGIRVTGTLDARGNCRRGTFRGTAPMLHVWMIPHRCGPFAGIEGSHGSGCSHGHDEPVEGTS